MMSQIFQTMLRLASTHFNYFLRCFLMAVTLFMAMKEDLKSVFQQSDFVIPDLLQTGHEYVDPCENPYDAIYRASCVK